MLKKFILLVLIGGGLVWTYYWYVRGINLLLEEQPNEVPPINWAVRVPAKEAPLTEPTWRSAANMPTARTAACAAASGEDIYVIGGMDGFVRTVATVEVFNTRTNEWRTTAPMPVAVHHAAAIGVGGKVYVFGGLTGVSGAAVSSAYVYDPAKATWRQLPDLPHACGGMAVAAVGDTVHLLGGESPSQVLAQHLTFDTKTETWNALEEIELGGRGRAAAVVARGRLWLLGGRGGSSLYNAADVWTWTLNDGPWDDAPQMNNRRSAFAAGVGDRLYVIDGEMPTSTNSTVEAYDFSKGQWELLAPMPRPRYGTASVQVDNRIFMFGGSAKAGFSVSDLVDVLEIPPAPIVAPKKP